MERGLLDVKDLDRNLMRILTERFRLGEMDGESPWDDLDPAIVEGADALYTDIWASMGEEALIPERVKLLTPFKVTKELMARTGNDRCIFLHCLPSFHDFNTTMASEQMKLGYDIREVTDDVFLSPNSKVFDEAENRLHTIKAVLVATLGNL